jgi:hypothetical protein
MVRLAARLVIAWSAMNWIICSVHFSQVMFGSWISVSNVAGLAGRV